MHDCPFQSFSLDLNRMIQMRWHIQLAAKYATASITTVTEPWMMMPLTPSYIMPIPMRMDMVIMMRRSSPVPSLPDMFPMIPIAMIPMAI